MFSWSISCLTNLIQSSPPKVQMFQYRWSGRLVPTQYVFYCRVFEPMHLACIRHTAYKWFGPIKQLEYHDAQMFCWVPWSQTNPVEASHDISISLTPHVWHENFRFQSRGCTLPGLYVLRVLCQSIMQVKVLKILNLFLDLIIIQIYQCLFYMRYPFYLTARTIKLMPTFLLSLSFYAFHVYIRFPILGNSSFTNYIMLYSKPHHIPP